MKIAIVVNDYPVVSQSFIGRLVDDLCDNDNVNVDIIVLNEYIESEVKEYSESNYNLIKYNKVNVISYCKRSDWFYIYNLMKDFISYVLKLPFIKSKISFKDLLSVNIKYHIKAAILLNIFGGNKYDIVHPQFINSGLSVVLSNNIFNHGKVFVTGRGADVTNHSSLRPADVNILENKYIGVTRYLFVSNSLLEHSVRKGVDSSKCAVLYSGIDINKLNSYSSNRSDKESVKLLQVGRLVEKKGIIDTITVFNELQSDFNVTLTIVGDGPLYSDAYKLSKETYRMEKIEFMGAKSNPECLQLIKDSDILLVPSKTGKNGDMEGIPNVAKEAMALGCLVVCSDHSGLKELIDDGETGFIFKEGNLKDYELKIRKAISEEENWGAIKNKANIKVVNNFSFDKVGRKLFNLYEKNNS